jgi:hypothetical protein
MCAIIKDCSIYSSPVRYCLLRAMSSDKFQKALNVPTYGFWIILDDVSS